MSICTIANLERSYVDYYIPRFCISNFVGRSKGKDILIKPAVIHLCTEILLQTIVLTHWLWFHGRIYQMTLQNLKMYIHVFSLALYIPSEAAMIVKKDGHYWKNDNNNETNCRREEINSWQVQENCPYWNVTPENCLYSSRCSLYGKENNLLQHNGSHSPMDISFTCCSIIKCLK